MVTTMRNIYKIYILGVANRKIIGIDLMIGRWIN